MTTKTEHDRWQKRIDDAHDLPSDDPARDGMIAAAQDNRRYRSQHPCFVHVCSYDGLPEQGPITQREADACREVADKIENLTIELSVIGDDASLLGDEPTTEYEMLAEVGGPMAVVKIADDIDWMIRELRKLRAGLRIV